MENPVEVIRIRSEVEAITIMTTLKKRVKSRDHDEKDSLKGMLSRPPLHRMMRIHELLQGKKYPNCSSIAREMEVSTKTIQRDFEFMRDMLGMPLEYDSRRHGYYYTQEVSSLPTMQISEGELVAIFLAQKALKQYHNTPFEKPLRAAFSKLASSLPGTITIEQNQWDAAYSFKVIGEARTDLAIFTKLSDALLKKKQLELSYQKLGTSRPENRIVDPYHLGNINGDWVLFAFDHSRKKIRRFVTTRIKDAKLTGEHFTRPASFSIQKELAHSFGIFSSQGAFDVEIEFDAFAATLVRERQWHPSQKITDLEEGRIRLSLHLHSLPEIRRWILSWGAHARVLHPAELVTQIREDIQKMRELYEQEGNPGPGQ